MEEVCNFATLPTEVNKMPASKAQQKAQNKWIAKAYDRINLTVAKGQKELIQAHAKAQGESVNGFIGRAINETMERDTETGGYCCPAAPGHAEGGAERRGDYGRGRPGVCHKGSKGTGQEGRNNPAHGAKPGHRRQAGSGQRKGIGEQKM